MMNLFGVMLFLRMGWMAGQAGVSKLLVAFKFSNAMNLI
jgi:hypothetical protein